MTGRSGISTVIPADQSAVLEEASLLVEPNARRLSDRQNHVGWENVNSILAIEPRLLYDAVLTRDRRFDGRMFVAVRSTRIYCRPICTVRPPRFENCTFYGTAAVAESKGYRPCLRCRPELAPGSCAPVDAVSRLASLAIRRIEDGGLSGRSIDDLAKEFGVSGRHLRRSIKQEVGLSPLELAQTQRLLLSKQLLTDTSMSVTQVAFAAGFESLRRFNTAFKEHYRLTPTLLRRSANSRKSDSVDAYHFDLGVRPPFDFNSLLTFWNARATLGVESVSEETYARTVVIGRHKGWLVIGPGLKEHTIAVQISRELGPVISNVLSRIKAMIDARANTPAVSLLFSRDDMLKPMLRRVPALRLPGTFDGFECGIRTIIGQQVSVQAASTVCGRLAARFGQSLTGLDHSLSTVFPSPETLASLNLDELQSIGLTRKRAETLQRFSRAISEGAFRLEPGADPDRVRSGLLEIPGIGNWTAEYLLMRAIGWPDAFPTEDLGLLKATGLKPLQLRDRAEQWRPWRSYAAILLWHSLRSGESAAVSKR